jgi:hypothetical protein
MQNRAEMGFLGHIYLYKPLILKPAYNIEFGVQFSNNGDGDGDDDNSNNNNNNNKTNFVYVDVIIPAIWKLRSRLFLYKSTFFFSLSRSFLQKRG